VHFYYIPIMYAAYRFGDYGAIMVSLLCAALNGPWMPAAITSDGPVPQGQWDIILRSLIFYVIGIASSRISLELKRRIYEANTMYEVARSITSTLRIRQVLNLIAQHAVQVMEARACVIRLLDRSSGELELAAQSGLSDTYADKGPVSLDASELDQIVMDGNVMQISDVSTDPRFQYPVEARLEGLAAVLSVPLTSKEEPRGVIRIYSARRRRFRNREIELLQAFARQAALAIENAELYEDIRRNYYETVRALTIAIEAKDSAVYSHSERVTELADKLAHAMGMGEEDVEYLRFGCILHDIGKIGVAETAMDAREQEGEGALFYRMHPLIGRSILAPIGFLDAILPVVVSHHEWWNGGGFPEGLAGNDIPRLARIVAICDRYERLVNPGLGSRRVGLSPREAVETILGEAGTRFEPEIVAAFHRAMSASGETKPAVLPAGPQEA
jgi:putative nucleotidyltransferase with HDIG domain